MTSYLLDKLAIDHYEPELQGSAVTQTPILGGMTQRQMRMGDKWKVTFYLKSVWREDANRYAAELTDGFSTAIKVRLNHTYGSVGTNIHVGANSQRGTTLKLTGLTPNATITKGRYFNISNTVANTTSLYIVREDAVANSTGAVSLVIYPPIKQNYYSANSTVEFNDVVIKGFLADTSIKTPVSFGDTVSMTFSLIEVL